MNLVTLYGRLVKDPELRYSHKGTAHAFAVVAVDKGLNKEKRQEAEANDQPTADFIPIRAFGKTAETLSTYFKKGNKIILEGKIQSGSYVQDKKTVYTTDVVVTKIYFVEKKEK